MSFSTPKSGWTLWIVVGMLVLSSLACGGLLSSPTATPEPTATPVPTPTPEPSPTPLPPTPEPAKPEPAAGGTALVINNQSPLTICWVYVSPSDSETWGPDQLGEGNTIASGESFTITSIPPGTYDIKAEDCNRNIIAQQYGLLLDASGFTWVITTAGQATLTIINNSSATICYIYISPTGSEEWGPDQLGSNIIEPGQQFVFTLGIGAWDLKAEDCDHNVLATEFNADINGEITWTLSD